MPKLDVLLLGAFLSAGSSPSRPTSSCPPAAGIEAEGLEL